MSDNKTDGTEHVERWAKTGLVVPPWYRTVRTVPVNRTNGRTLSADTERSENGGNADE